MITPPSSHLPSLAFGPPPHNENFLAVFDRLKPVFATDLQFLAFVILQFHLDIHLFSTGLHPTCESFRFLQDLSSTLAILFCVFFSSCYSWFPDSGYYTEGSPPPLVSLCFHTPTTGVPRFLERPRFFHSKAQFLPPAFPCISFSRTQRPVT